MDIFTDRSRVERLEIVDTDLRQRFGKAEKRRIVEENFAGPRMVSATVLADHPFLHSEFAGPHDSRYFGPIPADGILGLAQPVLIRAP